MPTNPPASPRGEQPFPAPQQPIVYWPIVALGGAITLACVVGVSAWVLAASAADDAAEPETPALVSAPAPQLETPPEPVAVSRPAPAPAAMPAAPEPAAPAPALLTETPSLLDSEASCGAPQSYGTSVTFLGTPAEAARQAQRDHKLLFILHVAGNFEDSRFT
jgi:hypothetical protein